MDKKTLAQTIDHAILKPDLTVGDLQRECDVARQYGVYSVCVRPSDVSRACRFLAASGVLVGTVIGFPHGTTTTGVKVSEAVEAIESGAKEVDMVINIGRLRSGDYDYVAEDIRRVVEAGHARGAVVKVILETALLDDPAKVKACELAEAAGADFVKTSTGFAGGGATVDDIRLMRAAVSDRVQIKASGGIRTYAAAKEFLALGCSRLGLSSTQVIMETEEAADADY